jgi:hypothetical protein
MRFDVVLFVNLIVFMMNSSLDACIVLEPPKTFKMSSFHAISHQFPFLLVILPTQEKCDAFSVPKTGKKAELVSRLIQSAKKSKPPKGKGRSRSATPKKATSPNDDEEDEDEEWIDIEEDEDENEEDDNAFLDAEVSGLFEGAGRLLFLPLPLN